MSSRRRYVLGALIVISLLSMTAQAEVPQIINYQANITSGDQPVTTPVSIVFAIYDDSTGGAVLWSETQVVEPDADGNVAVLLGTVNGIPDTAFTLSSYLGVTIDSDPEMQPRQRLVSVPNAFVAQSIDGDFQSAPGTILLEGGLGVTVVPRSNRNGLRKTLITGDSLQTVDDLGNTNCRQAQQDLLSNSMGEVHRATAAEQQLQNSLGAFNQNTAVQQLMQDSPGYTNTQRADQQVMQHPDGDQSVTTSKSLFLESTSGKTSLHKADEQVLQQTDGAYLKQTAQQQEIQTATGYSNIVSALEQHFQTPSGAASAHSAQSSLFTDETGKRFEQTAEYAKAYDDVDTAYLDKRQVAFQSGDGPRVIYGSQGMTIQPASADPLFRIDQTGVIEASGLQLQDGAVAGHVLTADANGAATWQAAPTGHWTDDGSVLSPVAYRGLTRGNAAGNTQWGDSAHTMVNFGVESTTGISTVNNVVYATIGGGYQNEAKGSYATVAGGRLNNASNNYNTIIGGSDNTANGFYTTIGGGRNNTTYYWYSSILGGESNYASGNYATAGGRRARAEHGGSFVWSDSTDVNFTSSAANEFSARATGGVRLVTAVDGLGSPTAGVQLAAGGSSWSVVSDRNAKENIQVVDPREILQRLADLPISTWNYKTQDRSIRHMGPMAQDLHAAFALGEDNTRINTVDADGIALAAIQGLYQENQVQKREIAELKALLMQLLEERQ